MTTQNYYGTARETARKHVVGALEDADGPLTPAALCAGAPVEASAVRGAIRSLKSTSLIRRAATDDVRYQTCEWLVSEAESEADDGLEADVATVEVPADD